MGEPQLIVPYDPFETTSSGESVSLPVRYATDLGLGGDDTALLQAHIDALGRYTATHPDYRAVTLGGGTVVLPPRQLNISDNVFYRSSLTIEGFGWTTQILFAPTSTKNCFEPHAETAALSGHHNVVFRNFAIFGQNANAQDGIHFESTRSSRIEWMYVADFRRYGIYVGAAAHGGKFHYANVVEHCTVETNTTQIYIDSAANGTSLIANYLRTGTGSAAIGDYLLVIKAADVLVTGGVIEGDPNVALVRVEGAAGVSFDAVYAETSSIADVPFVHRLIDATGAGTTYGIDVKASCQIQTFPLVKFEAWDRTSGESSAGTFRAGDHIAIGGEPVYVPLIPDGSFRNGYGALNGWATNPTNAWPVLDTSKKFNSQGSLQFIHTGSNVEQIFACSLATLDLTPYAGQQLYLQGLVYDPDAILTRFQISNTTRNGKNVVDYGNGWKLWVVDFNVSTTRLTNCNFQFALRSAVAGQAVNLVHLEVNLGGGRWLPTQRSNVPRDVRAAAAPTGAVLGGWNGTFTLGDVIENNMASVTNIDRWRVTAPGTISPASVTGDTTSGSPIITNIASTITFGIGEYVTVTADFAGTKKIIGKTATTLTLATNATGTSVGVTVATVDPTFAALAIP